MTDLLAARDRFAPTPRVHVVIRKEDIDASRLDGCVVVVLDASALVAMLVGDRVVAVPPRG